MNQSKRTTIKFDEVYRFHLHGIVPSLCLEVDDKVCTSITLAVT